MLNDMLTLVIHGYDESQRRAKFNALRWTLPGWLLRRTFSAENECVFGRKRKTENNVD